MRMELKKNKLWKNIKILQWIETILTIGIINLSIKSSQVKAK
jgi:hypothetical protein